MRPVRIISGGQTGADQAALTAARDLGIPTGGTAPRGWMTETGPAPWLADFGLVEHEQTGYQPRTRANVQNSDGTVIFGDIESRGSRLTSRLCDEEFKWCIVNPSPSRLRQWCAEHDIETLNVAGNRASVDPTIDWFVRTVLTEAFADVSPCRTEGAEPKAST